MSNPFSLFRKNQKAWIAGVGIAVMIGFGVLPVVLQMMGGGGDPRETENRVVFTIEGDVIRLSDMRQLGLQRQIVNRFYREVWRRQDQPTQLPMQDEALANTYLLAQKAQQWGIIISDDAINRHIEEVTAGLLSGADIQAAIRKIKFDRGSITDTMLFTAMRHQMMANRAADLIFGLQTDQNSFGDTPAQMWEYFRKLNRKLEIEAIAINVDDFINQIPKPGDAELTAFFEKYRNRRTGKEDIEGAILDSPTPGFYQPTRAKFQYIAADWDAIHKTITDEEIAKYYEEHKDEDFLDDIFEDPTDEPAEKQGDKKDGDPEKKEGDPAKKEGDKTEEKKPAESEPKESTDPSVEAKKPEKTDTSNEPETPKLPEDPATTDPGKPETPAKPETPKKPAAGEQSFHSRSDTALPTGTETEGPDADANGGEPKEPVVDDGKKKDDEKKDDGKDPKDDKKDGDPKDPVADDSKPTGGKKKDDAKKDDGKDDKKDAKKPKSYLPLDSVRDKIRDTLTEERVKELQEKAFDKLALAMNTYSLKFTRWDAADADKKKKPQNPLTEELVEKYGLMLHTTPWLSARELSELPGFGKSRVVTTIDFRGQPFQFPVPIPQAVFRTRADTPPFPKFQERRATNTEHTGFEYLFWKIEEKEAHVPELADVRDEVVRAWKSGRGASEDGKPVRALALAEKEAERLAETARTQARSLIALFGKEEPKKEDADDKQEDDKTTDKSDDTDDKKDSDKDESTDGKKEASDDAAKAADKPEPEKDDPADVDAVEKNGETFDIVEPTPFSWMTKTGPNMTLTQNIDGIDQAGPKFMETLFGMDIGDVGVAVNHAQTVVYVVRVVSVSPSESTLKDRFTRSTSDNLAGAAAYSNRRRERALLEALQREFNFEWVVAETQKESE